MKSHTSHRVREVLGEVKTVSSKGKKRTFTLYVYAMHGSDPIDHLIFSLLIYWSVDFNHALQFN